LTCEGKIKTKTLIRDSSFPSGVGAGSAFLQLGLNANRAGFKDWISMVELGYTVNIFMGIIKMFITYMVKSLMPKESFGRNMQLLNLKFRRIGRPVDVGNEFTNGPIVSTRIFRRSRIDAGRWSNWQKDGRSIE
jgi:hypothetical protein